MHQLRNSGDLNNVNQIGYGGQYVNIVNRSIRHYPMLNASGIRLAVRFINPDMENLEQWMRACIFELLPTIGQSLHIHPADRVGINFANSEDDNLNFAFSFRRYDQYTPDVILNGLEKVLQSNMRFFLDDCLVVKVDHVAMPVGYGSRTHIGKTTADYFKLHKRSIYNPSLAPEHSTMCLAVSLVVAKAYATDTNQFNFFTYSQNYNDLIDAAKLLCDNANTDLKYGGSIDEIIKFQDFLGSEYRITVFSSRDGKNLYFKSIHNDYKFTINLLLDCEHYSVVLKPTAAFATAYFCDHCCVGYTTQYGHKKCSIKCNCCFKTPPCPKDINVTCNDCNRTFVSAKCYHNHLRTTPFAKNNVCSTMKLCTKCTKCYTVKKTEHICGESHCRVCKTTMPIRHDCYMPIKKVKEPMKNGPLFIFYDFECHQNKKFDHDDNKFMHQVMLCVAHQACDNCTFVDDINNCCTKCGKREHVFIGDDVIENFMQYLGRLNDGFKQIIIIAHNGQKYDLHFILKYMYKHISEWRLQEESLIMNGTKILQIKVGRYSFLDSINFFSVPLAKLPAMFGFEDHSKGYSHTTSIPLKTSTM